MASASNYLENKIVDWILRGQAFSPPTDVYFALFTAAPSDSGGGTEVSGGSYARVELESSMTNWSGTQSAGSTIASSGTNGRTSNNVVVEFPIPSANWGSITHWGLFDADTSGNLLFHGALTSPKTINNGDPAPKFLANAFAITVA